jgi:lipopolysaccharide export system permease protein
VTRQFIYTLWAALVAFVVIYVIIDLIENLDTFIDNRASFALILKYYLLYIPFMANLTLPVAVLLSCLFTIGQMVRYNESVALKASGVSLYRVLFPLFRLGVLISVLTLLFGELVVPAANERRATVERVEIKKQSTYDRLRRGNIYLQDSPNRMVYVRQYSIHTRTALDVLIQEYDGKTLVQRIDARKMVWEDSEWLFQDGEVRTFHGEEEQFESFTLLRRKDFAFTPEDLAQQPKDPEEMNVFELNTYINRVKRMGGDAQRWLADFHLKLSFPFANMIIVLFCFVYYTVMEAGRALGRAGDLPPLAAAWMGNGVFGLIGLIILIRVRK